MTCGGFLTWAWQSYSLAGIEEVIEEDHSSAPQTQVFDGHRGFRLILKDLLIKSCLDSMPEC
jgi:hypothetical protein